MARVYILSKHDLFGQGILSLLRREPEIEIVGQGIQVDQALEDIKRLTPDAVIVESSYLTPDSTLTLTRMLKTNTRSKVVCMDLKENRIHVYLGEQHEARNVQDLVQAIKSDVSGSRTVE